MYESVLVPTDGSQHAERAYERGLALAEGFDADLHLLSVVDRTRYPEPALSESELVYEDVENTGQVALRRFATRAQRRGVPVRQRHSHGDPSREILRYANEHGVDVVVMGYQGEDHRRALGTTARRVVKAMDRPVLLV